MPKRENQELDVLDAVRQHLSQLQQFGIQALPTAQGRSFPQLSASLEALNDRVQESASPVYSAATAVESAPATTKTTPAAKSSPTGMPRPATTVSTEVDLRPYSAAAATDRVQQLTVLAQNVSGCTQCDALVQNRNQTVFGVGNPQARLVLFGEAPGEQEDRQGEPFVGAAGQLLDKMLAACGLNRHEDVYILNTIKCRPPRNRNPRPEEIQNCWSFTEQQLDILKPEFICCLGSVAARTLLRSRESVGLLRKQFHSYRGSKVLVTYHPDYLLKTSSAKKHAWEDLQMLMKKMGIPIPTKSK